MVQQTGLATVQQILAAGLVQPLPRLDRAIAMRTGAGRYAHDSPSSSPGTTSSVHGLPSSGAERARPAPPRPKPPPPWVPSTPLSPSSLAPSSPRSSGEPAP